MRFDEQIPAGSSSLPEQLARWRVNVAVRHVIAAQVLVSALIVALPGVQWWVAAAVAVVVLGVLVLTYNGATAMGWLVRLMRFGWFRFHQGARQRRAAIPAPFGVDLAGIGTVGMRWDGRFAVTMIALHGRAYAPTFLTPGGAKTEDIVPLELVASLLRQFGGLELASVDVVSAGRRTSDARFAATYDEIIGDRPAVGLRQTWLVLRLCPQACVAAMAYRGDAAAAAAAATERIRQAVLRSGCRAVTCGVDQFTAATGTLLGDVNLGEIAESWSHIDTGGDYVTTYRVAGKDLTTDLINDVWSVRSSLTVLTVRLAASSAGTVSAAGVVRFHTAQPLTHAPLLPLQPVSGQAFDALLASLPLGDRSLRLLMSPRRLDAAGLELPLAPAGFMIGTTRTGFPLLLALQDPLRQTRVQLCAEPLVVQSLVLRASATGSTVLVHTSRPKLWAPIRNEHIIVADPSIDHPGTATMVVLDGDDVAPLTASVGERGHTLVSVTSTPSADADVTITQTATGQMQLTTPQLADVALTVLRPRNETQYLAHLRDSGAVASVAR